jgi:hypothetical protein
MSGARAVPCIAATSREQIDRVIREGRPVVLRGLFDETKLGDLRLDATAGRAPAPAELRARFPLDTLCDDSGDRLHFVDRVPRGTSSRLRWDADQRGAILFQLVGQQRVVLIDPRDSHKLDPHIDPSGPTSAHLLANFTEDELAAFVAFTYAQVVVLQPGDSLFVPPVHWHFARSIERSMALTHRLGRGRGSRRLVELGLPPSPDVQMLARELSRAAFAEQGVPLWLDHLEAHAATIAGDLDRDPALLARCLAIREALPLPDRGDGDTAASTRELMRREALRAAARQPVPFAIDATTRIRLAPGVRVLDDRTRGLFLARNDRVECELSGSDGDLLAQLLKGIRRRRLRSATALARELQVDDELVVELLQSLAERGWIELAGPLDRAAATPTLGNVARDYVRAAAAALDVPGADALEETLDVMTASWHDRSIATVPPWSWLTTDLTPIELSVTFESRGADLRYAIEPHGDPATPDGYWRAALDLNAKLAARYGAKLARFDSVAELFRPQGEAPNIVAAQGVWVGRRPRPSFKIYFSPSARGEGTESDTLREACSRLGLAGAWSELERLLGRRAAWAMSSIDLDDGPDARFKLYERLMHDAEPEILRMADAAGEPSSPAFRALLETLPSAMRTKWLVLYHSLSERGYDRATLQVPIAPRADPTVVRRGIERLLTSFGLDTERYRRVFDACAAVSSAPPAHTYVSVQVIHGAPRFTVYFAPRAYEARYGTFDRAIWPSPVTGRELDA